MTRIIGRVLTPKFGNSMEQRDEARENGQANGIGGQAKRLFICACGRKVRGIGGFSRHRLACEKKRKAE